MGVAKRPRLGEGQTRLDSFLSRPAPPPPPPASGASSSALSEDSQHSAIPHPKILSFNTNGLSAYATGSGGVRRQRLVRWLVQMSRKFDFILIQESKLLPGESDFLQRELPDCWILYDNKQDWREGPLSAGTLVIVTPSGLTKHSPLKVDLPQVLSGHGSAVLMKARGPDVLDFLICNAYLYGGSQDKIRRQKEQIRAWSSLPEGVGFVFFVGDFNFPACGVRPIAPLGVNPTREELWGRFCLDRGLLEAEQSNPTFYSISRDNPVATRPDRAYHNFSEGCRAVFPPVASALERPWLGEGPKPKLVVPQDHVPLALEFISTAPPAKRAFPCLGAHLFERPDFKSRFLLKWGEIKGRYVNPVSYWENFKKTVSLVAYEMLADSSQKKVSSLLGKVNVLISLIRILNAGGQDAIGKASRLCALIGIDPPATTDPSPFVSALDRLFEEGGEIAPADPDPVLNMTPRVKGSNFVKEVKTFLPSTRRRLRGLRASVGGELVEEHGRIGSIVKEFYGDYWARGDPPSEGQIRRFLRRYSKRLDLNLIQVPTIGTFRKAVLESGNTCAGPDGIPFSAYRALHEEVAEALFNVFMFLKRGGEAADKFNFGLLHLIPKKDTDFVGETTLTVNNTDNRIMAYVVKSALLPAFAPILEGVQKGFLPGRRMTDHVETVNEEFYSSLSRKQQLFILFLDTRRAFDSIHHAFLFAVLRHIGLPEDWVNYVELLFCKVKVSPVIANDKHLWFFVLRGVKQGCPLSPLFFVICYDPLLVYIERTSHGYLVVLAAADDLAVLVRRFFHLWAVMKMIDAFAKTSGLGINYDKTAVLPTMVDEFDPGAILRSPWREVVLARRYVHLGVLIGHGVSVEDIFQEAHDGALARLSSFWPVLKRQPVHKRIKVVNVFIVPKYMYLGSFFLIPYTFCKIFLSKCYRLLVPHSSFKMSYLFVSKKRFGFDPPLVNLWGRNLVVLANKFPAESLNRESLRDAFWRGRPWIYKDSCRITEHRQMAALEFLQSWSDHPRNRENDLILALPLVSSFLKDRKVMYDGLVERAFAPSVENDVPRKLSLLGVRDACAHAALKANIPALPAKLPAYIRTVFLMFLWKGISTTSRSRYRTRGVEKNFENFPCPFCLTGVDDFAHFLSDCMALEAAKEVYFSSDLLSPLLPLLSSAPLQVFTLGFELVKDRALAQTTCAAVVCFVAGVYFARKRVLAGDRRAVDADCMLASVQKLVRASSPSKKGRVSKALTKFRKIIGGMAPDDIIAFTDGSALGNPGPAGAGAVVFVPGVGTFFLHSPLGISTNNVGELFAIGIVLVFLAELDLANIGRRALICSDSEIALGILKLGWAGDLEQPELLREVACRERALRASLQFIKVPAHAEEEGNEIADFLAKLAARTGRKEGMGPFRFETLTFRHSSAAPPFGGTIY